jgi:sulfatase maturation enzyme AslB (radical SAM superfamily)
MFHLIEQTNICNLKCVCCPNRFHSRPLGFMPHELFCDIIQQLISHDPRNKSIRVALHGFGEPLLSPHFFDNLQYLDDMGFSEVDFSSNGLALTPDVSEKLMSFRCLSWIRVSLNSSRKELMEQINTGSNFEVVVDNIQKFLDCATAHGRFPFKPVIQLMRTKQNPDEQPEDLYNLLGRRNFTVLIKRLDTLGDQIDPQSVDQLAFSKAAQPDCIFANTSLFVHWDGDLVGCCLDNTKSQIFGNAKDGIFSFEVQARKRELQEQFREKNFDSLPLCKQCLGA